MRIISYLDVSHKNGIYITQPTIDKQNNCFNTVGHKSSLHDAVTKNFVVTLKTEIQTF